MTGAAGDGRREGLTALAASVLAGGDPETGLYDEASFIRLGGSSMQAITLAALASEQVGITLELSTLLSDTPLAAVLADAVATQPVSVRAPAPPAPGSIMAGEGTGMSSAQRAMWLREQVIGPLPYNLVFTCVVDGPLDAALLTEAVSGVVQRHEGLRTVFPEADDGTAEPRVLPWFRPPVRQRPHQGSEANFAADVRALAAAEGRRIFDLNSVPPLKFLLVSRGPDRHALIMVVHHILMDGAAIGLFLREVFARYDALDRGHDPGQELPVAQPAEHRDRLARLRRSGELDRQAAFWRQHLRDAPTVLDLPADRARPAVKDPLGERLPFSISPEVSAAVRHRAQQVGITPAAFLLAALALTLSRYTGARTILIGMPVAWHPEPRLAQLIANTANLVPIRIDVDEDQTAGAFLTSAQESLARSLDHSALPFADVAAAAGVSGQIDRHPLVQVALGINAGLIPRHLTTSRLDLRVEEGHGGGSQFDLELLINRDAPSFAGDLEYATSVWREPEAAAFCADLAAAIGDLSGSPTVPLESVRCLAPGRQILLDRINETVRPYPATSIDEEFRAQVQRTPDAVAVRAADGQMLTYAELAHAASAQATLLAGAGVTAGSTVLVATGRSIAEEVAVLGALWVGAAYVGLEPGTPPARVDQIAAIVRPAAVVGDRVAGVPRVSAWPELPPSGIPAVPSDPDRLAYVAFTSGSTGVPKGVCVTHRGILRLIAGLPDYVPVGPADRMMRFCSLSFDVSTFEIFGALLTGAALEIHPPGVPSAAKLGRFIRDAGITVAWLTAGLFSVACDYALDYLGGLHYLLAGGDIVSPEHVRRLLTRYPGVTFINGYGPAENTTFSTAYPVTDPAAVDDPLPIGKPIANTQVYILDRRGRPVPPGAVGELYTAGDGLAAGYFGDAEQTARVFGQLSPMTGDRLYKTGDIFRLDTRGRLQFLGRRDDQVKILGCRVELGELRAALVSHPRVADAFITVSGTGNDRQLVAACIPARGLLDVPELATFLAGRLPAYMVPLLWDIVSEFPLTATGKVDREALRQSARPVAAYQ